MKIALYWKKLKSNTVQCQLCPNFCVIKPELLGKCGTRKNINGKLFSIVYGKPVAANADVIEKKPLYHFLPGSLSFSIATIGCNLFCKHCQNWEISRASFFEVPEITPEEIVEEAKENGCSSIAYTYTEPTVFYEYMLDIAKLAKKQGLKNVIVSNAYINEEPLAELCKYIHAANIDLKAMNEKFYKEICSAKLQPVLEAIKLLFEKKIWLEITNLVIPKKNDSQASITKLVNWILENLGQDVPLHFSRFFPAYKMLNLQPTPVEKLIKAKEIALQKGMKFVYIGNILAKEHNSTYCPNCKELLIERSALFVENIKLKQGKCPKCGTKIPGVWQ